MTGKPDRHSKTALATVIPFSSEYGQVFREAEENGTPVRYYQWTSDWNEPMVSASSPASDPLVAVLDHLFRDSQGQIVIAQMPNPPLLIGIGASFAQRLLPEGSLRTGAEWITFAALFIWAGQEVVAGVNLFRRSLGLTVLVSLIASALQPQPA